MKKMIPAAGTFITFIAVVGCSTMLPDPTGPQELFNCTELSKIVYKGASKKSIEKVFGIGTEKGNKEGWYATRTVSMLKDSQARALSVTYDKKNNVIDFKITKFTADQKQWPVCEK